MFGAPGSLAPPPATGASSASTPQYDPTPTSNTSLSPHPTSGGGGGIFSSVPSSFFSTGMDGPTSTSQQLSPAQLPHCYQQQQQQQLSQLQQSLPSPSAACGPAQPPHLALQLPQPAALQTTQGSSAGPSFATTPRVGGDSQTHTPSVVYVITPVPTPRQQQQQQQQQHGTTPIQAAPPHSPKLAVDPASTLRVGVNAPASLRPAPVSPRAVTFDQTVTTTLSVASPRGGRLSASVTGAGGAPSSTTSLGLTQFRHRWANEGGGHSRCGEEGRSATALKSASSGAFVPPDERELDHTLNGTLGTDMTLRTTATVTSLDDFMKDMPVREDPVARKAIDDLRKEVTDKVVRSKVMRLPKDVCDNMVTIFDNDQQLMFTQCTKERGNIVAPLISRLGTDATFPLIKFFLDHLVPVGQSMGGCVALPRILSIIDPSQYQVFFATVLENLSELVCHEYGNFVVKHFVGSSAECAAIAQQYLTQPDVFCHWSSTKPGSHLIEAVLLNCGEKDIHAVSQAVLTSEPHVRRLANDRYGNYCLQGAFKALNSVVDSAPNLHATCAQVASRAARDSPYAQNIMKRVAQGYRRAQHAQMDSSSGGGVGGLRSTTSPPTSPPMGLPPMLGSMPGPYPHTPLFHPPQLLNQHQQQTSSSSQRAQQVFVPPPPPQPHTGVPLPLSAPQYQQHLQMVSPHSAVPSAGVQQPQIPSPLLPPQQQQQQEEQQEGLWRCASPNMAFGGAVDPTNSVFGLAPPPQDPTSPLLPAGLQTVPHSGSGSIYHANPSPQQQQQHHATFFQPPSSPPSLFGATALDMQR